MYLDIFEVQPIFGVSNNLTIWGFNYLTTIFYPIISEETVLQAKPQSH